jgi:hypothetical protein
VTPTISGAALASVYSAGVAPELRSDERSTGANGAQADEKTRAAAKPAAQGTVAIADQSGQDYKDAASFNLETLAAAVGLDPDELLNQVKAGMGSNLLDRNGETGYGSTLRDSLHGGIVFDEYA